MRGPKHPITEQLLFKEGEYMGNNPYPLCNEKDYKSRCCDMCDSIYVLPSRMGYDVFSDDWETRTEAFKFGMSMWNMRLEGRKLIHEQGHTLYNPLSQEQE